MTAAAPTVAPAEVPDVLGDRVVCRCGYVSHVPLFLADGTLICPEGNDDDAEGLQSCARP